MPSGDSVARRWWLAAGLAGAGVLVTIALITANRSNEEISTEYRALANSVRLSAGDIEAVLNAFDDFRYSNSADAIADRTLQRPALADPDSVDPAIERFYYDCRAARRFLQRIDARLASPRTSTHDLERLLRVTDERATSLEESWLMARRAALRRGGGGMTAARIKSRRQ
ncbi:hypothetical protein [Corynebacterium atypicum]|uniref:hypothetical protein n=1 Tax=Corynebacterium atypicum TaxID=191610 RepID=UPI00068F7476|nr:hypothetical protein [Corynebacterium atypicum]